MVNLYKLTNLLESGMTIFQFLEDNQWKLYPLLRNILNVFLPPHEPGYRILYTLYPEGFLSVIAEPLKSEEA